MAVMSNKARLDDRKPHMYVSMVWNVASVDIAFGMLKMQCQYTLQ